MSADFNQDKGILIYASPVIDKDGAELHFTYHFCLSPEDTLASLYWRLCSYSISAFESLSNSALSEKYVSCFFFFSLKKIMRT